MRRRNAILIAVLMAVPAAAQQLPPQVRNNAYGATWNGVTFFAPSQNAVYDKIEAVMVGAIDPILQGIITATPAANSMVYWTGPAACALLATTTYGRSLLTLADANELTGALNVRGFGAVGDGVTDDAAAFAAAKAEAGTRTIIVPPGVYIFASAIDFAGPRWLGMSRDGTTGSVLKASAANATGICVNTVGANPLTLENLCLRSANGGGVALDFPDNHYVTGKIENCQIYAEFEIGIRACPGDLRVVNTWIGYNGTPGANWTPFYSIADESASFQNVTTRFDTVMFRQACGGVAAVVLDYGSNIEFDNCIWETCTVPAIDANGTTTVRIVNSAFEDLAPGGTGNCVIYGRYNATIAQGAVVELVDCRFSNTNASPWDALYYASGSGCFLHVIRPSGGLTATYFCKDSAGLYDNAQTLTSRGLLYVEDNYCAGYAGGVKLQRIWHKFSHGPKSGGTAVTAYEGDLWYDTTDGVLVIRDEVGDKVLADPNQHFSITIADDGDWDNEVVPIWQAPDDKAVTLKKIRATVLGSATPVLTYNIEERLWANLASAGTDTYASDQTADADGEIETTLANTNINAGAHLVFTTGTGAESGTVTYIQITVYYQRVIE